MREIKFRAWDKGLSNDDNIPMMTQALTIQEWLDQRGFYYVNGYQANLSDFDWKNELIFMQYTCLKDKNGIEIYEGDVVKVIIDNEVYGIGEVVFCLGSYSLEFIDDKEANIEPIITVKKMSLNQELEVIGNIYEHPHLLGGE